MRYLISEEAVDKLELLLATEAAAEVTLAAKGVLEVNVLDEIEAVEALNVRNAVWMQRTVELVFAFVWKVIVACKVGIVESKVEIAVDCASVPKASPQS